MAEAVLCLALQKEIIFLGLQKSSTSNMGKQARVLPSF
jgi:hypothetical protein